MPNNNDKITIYAKVVDTEFFYDKLKDGETKPKEGHNIFYLLETEDDKRYIFLKDFFQFDLDNKVKLVCNPDKLKYFEKDTDIECIVVEQESIIEMSLVCNTTNDILESWCSNIELTVKKKKDELFFTSTILNFDKKIFLSQNRGNFINGQKVVASFWMSINYNTFIELEEIKKDDLVKKLNNKISALVKDDKATIPAFNDQPFYRLKLDKSIIFNNIEYTSIYFENNHYSKWVKIGTKLNLSLDSKKTNLEVKNAKLFAETPSELMDIADKKQEKLYKKLDSWKWENKRLAFIFIVLIILVSFFANIGLQEFVGISMIHVISVIVFSVFLFINASFNDSFRKYREFKNIKEIEDTVYGNGTMGTFTLGLIFCALTIILGLFTFHISSDYLYNTYSKEFEDSGHIGKIEALAKWDRFNENFNSKGDNKKYILVNTKFSVKKEIILNDKFVGSDNDFNRTVLTIYIDLKPTVELLSYTDDDIQKIFLDIVNNYISLQKVEYIDYEHEYLLRKQIFDSFKKIYSLELSKVNINLNGRYKLTYHIN